MDGSAAHQPVLPGEVVQLLQPATAKVLLDCTVGLGGHSELLLSAAPQDALLIGIDLDEENLRQAKVRLARFAGRVRLFAANFGDVKDVLAEVGVAHVDALLADLGVSSPHLDQPERGFSFQNDGPLDMRLGPTQQETTAADLVNTLAEEPLANLIFEYGEERYSRRIARAIVQARLAKRIERTLELAQIVSGAIPGPARYARHGVHPATRTFQALRIAVNDEMGNLRRLLEALPEALSVGGRAAIISFHSLEDRPVKHTLGDWAATGKAKLLTKKPLIASDAEQSANPRSRSAKLRGVQRIE